MPVLVPFRGLIALVALLFAVSDAAAQDTSPWVKDLHSQLRLLAGSRGGPVLMGAIEIQLEDNWKTYWRYPGDSGVPPRFDFSQSENVDSVIPLFPAPKSFPDGAGGLAIGYQKQLVLPLRITPKNPNEPVLLRAKIDYAVCEKLCLPVEAVAEVAFASTASAQDSIITAALTKVPKPVASTDNAPIALRSFKRDGKMVTITLAAQHGGDLALFAEGPTPEWALPLPKRIPSPEPGDAAFSFELDGLPSDAQPEGATLKLTVVGNDGAFEYKVRLN